MTFYAILVVYAIIQSCFFLGRISLVYNNHSLHERAQDTKYNSKETINPKILQSKF